MNRDGLQDSNDLPVQGLNVTLHKFVTTINQNEGKKEISTFDDSMVRRFVG